ncbi:MAG: ATP synthase F1 subunit delta [Dehalococcoidia bacterium]|nr:ATP synthase F1 subunit delta [Dehalococcoidia bacterium]
MTQLRDVAGRRYALAVAEMARAGGDFDAWMEAADGLAALTANSAHVALLQGDGMTDERFGAIVRQVVPGIDGARLNLFRLLRRKGRLGLGGSIASYLRELWDAERGVERAEVRTAVPLDDEQRRRMAQRLSARSGRTVEIEAVVDPALLGGAVIRIGDRLIDGSTRGRLRELRERLAQPGAASPA